MSQRIIDLTFPIHEGMTTFPVHWHPMVEITQLGRHGIEDRETRKLVLGTHTGTHCDAPRHFVPNGQTIDQIALDRFIGPAFVANFTLGTLKREYTIADFAELLGTRVPERVVMRFDWSDHWGKMAYYTDHPYITTEAATWLADRGCRLLAMDTPMPDNPKNGRGTTLDSPVHKILLGRGVILVEYLTNLRNVMKNEIELIVAPLNILNGDGAPARCAAIERD